MKFYLNLDASNYLLSASETNTGGPTIDSLEGYDFSGHRIRAHWWDGEKLVLDEERLAQLSDESTEPEPGQPSEDTVSWDVLAAAIQEGVDSV